jgi:hypothetical protein
VQIIVLYKQLAEATENFVSTSQILPPDIDQTLDAFTAEFMSLSLYHSADPVAVKRELKNIVQSDSFDKILKRYEGMRIEADERVRRLSRQSDSATGDVSLARDQMSAEQHDKAQAEALVQQIKAGMKSEGTWTEMPRPQVKEEPGPAPQKSGWRAFFGRK